MELKFTAKSKQKLASAHPEMNKWVLAVSRSEMRHFSARSRKPGTCAKRGQIKGLCGDLHIVRRPSEISSAFHEAGTRNPAD
jgi:hypothetical protein